MICFYRVALFCLAAIFFVSCSGTDKSSGIKLENMDLSVSPGNNFFDYTCRGFNEKHPLTSFQSSYGNFDILSDKILEQTESIVSKLSGFSHNEDAKCLATLYSQAMDSVKLNKDGAKAVFPILENISAITDKTQIMKMSACLSLMGIDSYFGAFVDADAKDSKTNILQLVQSGFSLEEKAYYFDTDESSVEIRKAYNQYISTIFEQAGYTEKESLQKTKDVLRIETLLADAALSSAELRDPEANYHKITYEELKTLAPEIEWDDYFNELGVVGFKDINISQVEPIKRVSEILSSEPLQLHKSYLQFKVLNSAAIFLSDEFVATHFDFFGKTLTGSLQNHERRKRAIGVLNEVLPELLGKYYVEQYFSGEAKAQMLQLVNNLQEAFATRIQEQEWMCTETKEKALDKLSSMRVKIGYPDRWKDYSSLKLTGQTYWDNICIINKWNNQEMYRKLGKPVDRNEWLMSPQSINAYYSPLSNEICFPAGLLQYPFFDKEADEAYNYGAIGVIIGHEMTHGFDDEGRHFDENGNMAEWWTSNDIAQFEGITEGLKEHFNKIEVLPGMYADGQLTLGENIADHGGLNISYTAFKRATKEKMLPNKDGFTADQRFFLAYSSLWAGNIREEEIRLCTATDTHSLGRWRVNGTLPHIDAWYEAFNISPSDSLYLAKDKRINIW